MGDGVQGANNYFQRKLGRDMTIDKPSGDIDSRGVIDVGFSWELHDRVVRSEVGPAGVGAKIVGECGFNMREHGTKVSADATCRAFGSHKEYGGVEAAVKKKSFNGQTRGDVASKIFVWMATTVGNQWGEVANKLGDAADDYSHAMNGFQPY